MATTKFYASECGDFFQVIRETAKTVTVRPVKSECIGTTAVHTAFDYDVKHHAVANDFTTVWYLDAKQNANGKRCKKDTGGDWIVINSDYRIWAYPCADTAIFNRNLG